MITVNELEEASLEDQKAILSLLHEYHEEEILCTEFYPVIVKHAKTQHNSSKISLQLLIRAAENSNVESRKLLIKSGAVSVFLMLLLSDEPELVKVGLKSLTGIAVEPDNSKYIMISGAVVGAQNILFDLPDEETAILTLDFLRALSKESKGCSRFLIPCFSFFLNLLDHYGKNQKILSRFFETMLNTLVHNSNNEILYSIKDCGLIPLFNDLINWEEIAGWRVNNIFCIFLTVLGRATQEDIIDEYLKTDALQYFSNYFLHNGWSYNNLFIFCQALKNITFYSRRGRDIILNSTDLQEQIVYFSQHSGWKMRKIAVNALRQLIISASKTEFNNLIESGCIEAFCSTLYSNDIETLHFALSGLLTILKASDEDHNYAVEVEHRDCLYRLLEIAGNKDDVSRNQLTSIFRRHSAVHDVKNLSSTILKLYFQDYSPEVTIEEIKVLLPGVNEEGDEYRFKQICILEENIVF